MPANELWERLDKSNTKFADLLGQIDAASKFQLPAYVAEIEACSTVLSSEVIFPNRFHTLAKHLTVQSSFEWTVALNSYFIPPPRDSSHGRGSPCRDAVNG